VTIRAWGTPRAKTLGLDGDRSIILNQVVLAGIVLLSTVLAVLLGTVLFPTILIIGVTLTFAATGLSFALPWTRLPAWTMLALPVADIVAIAFMRASAPSASLGLLWIFPVVWIASAFAGRGAIFAVLLVSLIYWALTAVDDAALMTPATVLLPVVIAAVAIIASSGARRANAQRVLLDKQSALLQRSVDRARRQEDLVTEVLQAVDFGVIRLTPDGELVMTNDAHGRLQRASLVGTRAYGADGFTRLDDDDLPLARARRGEEFENALVWYGEPGDEQRRALRSTARRLRDKDLSDAGMILVTLDVTAEELALRSREDLIASVSHELRTPLTSITGYVELALDDPGLSPVTRRSLEVVERNAGRLLDLVADLLAASAASRMGVELTVHTEPTDLSAAVAGAVEAATPWAEERRITIDTSAVTPVRTVADPHRMRQVIDNLLSNAIKYNRVGGRVDVALDDDGSHVWLRVTDTGHGIPETELPRLFERFFRSDRVRKSTTHGSGLGLAISREIVRAHAGEITVRTATGEGSTFTVRLPAHAREEGR